MKLIIYFSNKTQYIVKNETSQNIQVFINWLNDPKGLPMFQYNMPKDHKSVFFKRDMILFVEVHENNRYKPYNTSVK